MLRVVAISDGRENLRIRVLESINTQLSAFCADRKISKQDAIDGLLEWFLEQDETLQLLIVGRVPASDQNPIARMVLNRLSERPKKSKRNPGTPARDFNLHESGR